MHDEPNGYDDQGLEPVLDVSVKAATVVQLFVYLVTCPDCGRQFAEDYNGIEVVDNGRHLDGGLSVCRDCYFDDDY